MQPIRRIFCTALMLLSAFVDAAQTDQSAAIAAARSALQRADLDDAQRDAAGGQLDAAAAAERAAADFVARREQLLAEAAALPQRMARLDAALAVDYEQDLAQWAKRLPADADEETLERLLERERAEVADLQAQIDAAGAELAAELARPVRAASEIAALRRRVDELSVAVTAPGDESDVLREARALSRSAELHRAQAELDLRGAEQETATQRQRELELSLRELRHRLELDQRRIGWLQERISQRSRADLQARLAQLASRELELAGAAPVIAIAATENRALGDELAANQERLARDRRVLSSSEEERDFVTETLRDSRTRLEVGGANERVGQWLWSERRRLEPPARLRQQLQTTRVALADLRLRLLALSDAQRELADIPALVRSLREANAADTDEAQTDGDADAMLPPLLQQRAELVEQLRPLLERRVAALEATERALQARLDATLALQDLLDRHLLWLPSHTVVDLAWLSRVPDGVADLVKPSRLATTLQLCGRSIRDAWMLWSGSVVLLLVLLELRRRAPARIEAEATAARRLADDGYRTTLRAFVWTLLGALPAPATLALLGYLLQQVGNPGRYSDSLGRALATLVGPLLAVQLLRWTVLERGLAHAHFRWVRQRRETLRRVLPIAAAVVLPMYFVEMLASLRRADIAIDVQARLAEVIAAVALAWVFWRVLEAGRLWVVRGVTLQPSLLRRLLRALLPAFLLGCAGLALAGYIYSAGMLLQATLSSIELLVVVTLALGMVGRWFLLGERRLAMRRQHELAVVQADSEVGEGTAEPAADVTLEQVSAQTARLLRALRVSLLTLGLIWVWMDVLPAIYRLDEIVLWHFNETGADGASATQAVTLGGALLGLFVLALTLAASRNLPGLIEISLLSRAGVDAASRYAITSLLRYAIVISGTLIGLGYLGLRWSQLQWMAAALTVGLGFGLQEIFANFVSGIILLFERPFRVGDVITVGDMTGRITRIRTRATTILDFDNKEIVMPNKTFITGHLTNWALSDSTTRVIVRVGVAYGSNPMRVRELLLQAAAEDSRVLAEPAPSCWFLAFGASSLDFELRVFVATLADRLEAQTALNMRINTLLAENGIEIAFPQLDIHVRDLPR
jgi:potassium-dependent mechanosensitive channel